MPRARHCSHLCHRISEERLATCSHIADLRKRQQTKIRLCGNPHKQRPRGITLLRRNSHDPRPMRKLNLTCPCMDNGVSTKNYPKKLQEETTWCEGGYPRYRRREFVNGQRVMHRVGVRDNRWAAPYNPRLLKKFKYHLNVGICTSIKTVTHLYKYTYKGPDRACMEMINELTEFLDARCVITPEAAWRRATPRRKTTARASSERATNDVFAWQERAIVELKKRRTRHQADGVLQRQQRQTRNRRRTTQIH